MTNLRTIAALMFFAALFLLCSSANAVTFISTGNPGDTASGEVITAFATSEILSYTDINDNPKPQVNPATDITVTVLAVYGVSTALLSDRIVYTGQINTIEGSFVNEGNTSDNGCTGTYSASFAQAGVGTWTVRVRRKSDNFLAATLTPGSMSSSESITLAEDSEYGFYFEVIAPANGDPGARVGLTYMIVTASTPNGQYSGANGLSYGGASTMNYSFYCTIEKPSLIITRTATVDAPKSSVGYAGGVKDAVPGSIISYLMTYSNTGNSTADSVVLVDKVPGYTNLAHINQTGSTTNVNLTLPQGSATGWTLWYSTLSSPDKTYGNSSDWTMIGTLETTSTAFPSSNTYVSGNSQWNAAWIKWEKKSVIPAEDNQTLLWGVTIR